MTDKLFVTGRAHQKESKIAVRAAWKLSARIKNNSGIDYESGIIPLSISVGKEARDEKTGLPIYCPLLHMRCFWLTEASGLSVCFVYCAT